MKSNGFLIVLLVMISGSIFSQDTIMPLWPKDKIPNRIVTDEKEVTEITDKIRIRQVQEPSIEVYLPSKSYATGKAVLIFPGGGYSILAYKSEGTDLAKFFNSKGVAGIVVKYRLPKSKSLTERHNVPLIDAQRAIRLVRSHADQWNIKADSVGIMGFSAGGHLASTLGTHFDEKVYDPIDNADVLSARPDFMALIYPVVTFKDNVTHEGSRKALLEENENQEMKDYFSNELWVNQNTPPTILVHSSDDEVVPVENSVLFYKALVADNIPATMHIYPTGGHGYSLALNNEQLKGWPDRIAEWLQNLPD